eukprot:351893-Chlamydomonas_euryale.AAC.27
MQVYPHFRAPQLPSSRLFLSEEPNIPHATARAPAFAPARPLLPTRARSPRGFACGTPSRQAHVGQRGSLGQVSWLAHTRFATYVAT